MTIRKVRNWNQKWVPIDGTPCSCCDKGKATIGPGEIQTLWDVKREIAKRKIVIRFFWIMQFEFWNTNILLLPICVYIYLFGDVPSYFSTTEIMVIFTFYRAITVGRKAFLFFCFLCMRKTFFYATKSCFLLIQLFCMCSLKTNPVFLQSKPFFIWCIEWATLV